MCLHGHILHAPVFSISHEYMWEELKMQDKHTNVRDKHITICDKRYKRRDKDMVWRDKHEKGPGYQK